MKAKNSKLAEMICKMIHETKAYSYSDEVMEAIDKLYLAIFEDEKDEDVFITMQELKEEGNDPTQIAEKCADLFNVNFEGGPLDDPDHWIWELAAK